jgi:predicted TPR repeat methyltransferase
MTPSAPASAQDEASLFARIKTGMELQRAGHTQQAEIIYRDILKESPGQPDALHMLGVAAFQRGDYERSIELIREVISQVPEFPDAHNSLGVVLKRVGETEQAIEAYRRAIALRHTYPEAHHNLAIALEAVGRHDEAEEAIMARLSLVPEDPGAQIDLGYLLFKKGRADEALAAFQRVLKVDPRNVDAHRNMWVVYYRSKRFEEAEQALRKWREYDPENAFAEHMLAAFSNETPARASDGYVQQVFERMAPGFDEQLASLGYRAPDLVSAALTAVVGPAARALDILDAGCGTGLCGPLLRGHARRLAGVDLSRHMLTQAEGRGCYDSLAEAELTAFLGEHPGAWNAIVSADTLCYFGDLAPVLSAAATALTPLGWLVFTVERLEEPGADYQLHRHGRYSHAETYVRRMLMQANLELRGLGFEPLRLEGGVPVAGLVVTASKPTYPA